MNQFILLFVATVVIVNAGLEVRHLRRKNNALWAVLADLQAANPMTASHASAPTGFRCADCQLDGEACPTCYAAWWKQRHPNVYRSEDVQ